MRSARTLKALEGNDTPPTAPAPTFGSGKFSFTPAKVATIPVIQSKIGTANPLPFREWFTWAASQGDEAHGQTIFVPDSFWTAPVEEGGRGLPTLAKPQVIRAKYRELFRVWRTEPEHAEARAKFGLVVAPRTAGQETGNGGETYAEDGNSLFITDSTRT